MCPEMTARSPHMRNENGIFRGWIAWNKDSCHDENEEEAKIHLVLIESISNACVNTQIECGNVKNHSIQTISASTASIRQFPGKNSAFGIRTPFNWYKSSLYHKLWFTMKPLETEAEINSQIFCGAYESTKSLEVYNENIPVHGKNASVTRPLNVWMRSMKCV